MTPEAPLARSDEGTSPTGPGWFVLNARDARWFASGGSGARGVFEAPGAWMAELGIQLAVLEPGERLSHYHAEEAQEDFLLLAGSAVLVIEGEERALAPWDLVHCPPGTAHAIVAQGDRPCLLVAVGARHGEERFRYPVEPLAARHGASVAVETTEPDVAYADAPPWQPTPCPLDRALP